MTALQLLGAAWESMTIGELMGGVGLLGGGAGTVYLARWGARAFAATVRALDLWGRALEAQTAAARASAGLAPLQAEALRLQIRTAGGKVLVEAEDSDELRVLRVAAEGTPDELERVVDELARLDPEATLNRKLSATEQRLVELARAAAARRKAGRPEADAPRPRERGSSWLRRRAT